MINLNLKYMCTFVSIFMTGQGTTEEQLLKQVKLAIKWDRIDIAEEHIQNIRTPSEWLYTP